MNDLMKQLAASQLVMQTQTVRVRAMHRLMCKHLRDPERGATLVFQLLEQLTQARCACVCVC